ncbi:MAG: hypothetical protein ACOC4Z_02505 [Patescibacteria group bacterium]
MGKNLPKIKKFTKPLIVGIICFFLGAGVGGTSLYFYSRKVLIPKYKNQIMSELFGGSSSSWGDFFESIEDEEGEYSNPFESTSEEQDQKSEEEEYVNPFENLE